MAHPTRAVPHNDRHFPVGWLCLLLILAGLAGCSSSNQVAQQSRTAASAAQTVSMVLDAWVEGAAPSPYATAALHSVGKTLADVEAQIRSAETPEPAGRAGLTAAVNSLSVAVAHAEAGLRVDNRTEVKSAQQDLRAAMRSLAAAYTSAFGPKP
ncbi:hypothetical protein [Mesorhizobium sp. M0478]|uniref:hypothetical protein n=1 Tax=unclassified Mesorhizobium TaxID=325217 RepID=UPI00333BCDF8